MHADIVNCNYLIVHADTPFARCVIQKIQTSILRRPTPTMQFPTITVTPNMEVPKVCWSICDFTIKISPYM